MNSMTTSISLSLSPDNQLILTIFLLLPTVHRFFVHSPPLQIKFIAIRSRDCHKFERRTIFFRSDKSTNLLISSEKKLIIQWKCVKMFRLNFKYKVNIKVEKKEIFWAFSFVFHLVYIFEQHIPLFRNYSTHFYFNYSTLHSKKSVWNSDRVKFVEHA